MSKKSETTGWQHMHTAPRDGSTIIVTTADAMTFPAFWGGGLLNLHCEEVGGWHASEEGRHPPCWTDGICWESNEAGQRSAQPVAWRPADE